MGYSQLPIEAFESEDLNRIEAAFNRIWSALIASDPLRNSDSDQELQTLVRRKLFALAKAGVCDSEMLVKLAWETSELHSMNGREN